MFDFVWVRRPLDLISDLNTTINLNLCILSIGQRAFSRPPCGFAIDLHRLAIVPLVVSFPLVDRLLEHIQHLLKGTFVDPRTKGLGELTGADKEAIKKAVADMIEDVLDEESNSPPASVTHEHRTTKVNPLLNMFASFQGGGQGGGKEAAAGNNSRDTIQS